MGGAVMSERVALVCIAKNEDRYIQEWVDYHLSLGFDRVIIACDEWRCPIKSDKQVTVINIERAPGIPPQIPVYNGLLDLLRDKYDWVAFFDCDEFLVLKQHKTIQEFLRGRMESVGINWVLFGDNGLTEDDGSYGVLDRFTRCQSVPNQHVKCIVKCDPDIEMASPHNPNKSWRGSDGELHDYAFCPNGNTDEAQLNHYFSKTIHEYKSKQARGGPDGFYTRPDSDFERHNFNDIEDLSAKIWKNKNLGVDL
jgi:hypothetical protein